jgi:hypothetical protein
MVGSTTLAVTSTTFTSPGAAPVQLQVLGQQPVPVLVADSLPAVGTAGFILGNDGGPSNAGKPTVIQPADSACSSHRWTGVDVKQT